MGSTNRLFMDLPGVSRTEGTVLLGRNWGWLLAAGLALTLLGILALSVPFASTLGLTYSLAYLFLVYGFVQLMHAFKLRHERGGVTRFLQAGLAVLLGLLMLFQPGLGMLGISLALSCYFFVAAALNWTFAQALSPDRTRFWIYLSALASFVLGFYIVFTFPLSALWLPGTLLGIEFVFNGVGLVGLAFTVRKMQKSEQTPVGNWQPTEQPT